MKRQYIQHIILMFLLFFNLFKWNQIQGQEVERPFILVKSSERDQILEKINTQNWANEIYESLKLKSDFQVSRFYKNPIAYI